METEKLHYFLAFYCFNNSSGYGYGNVGFGTIKPMFTHDELSELVKKSDKTITSVTLTGFNELTEEQYLIFAGKK